MATSRALYVTFYLLYLITLAIGLWFLLYYTDVPMWVWTFFGLAILMIILSFLIQEYLIRKVITSGGTMIQNGMFDGWGLFLFFINIFAIILVITGIAFVVAFSRTIPSWVWLLLGLAILFSFLGNIIAAFGGVIFSVLSSLIALTLFIIGIIFYITYADAPWWVWMIISLAIIFAIMANIFGSVSDKPLIICGEPETETECLTTNTMTNLPVTTNMIKCNKNIITYTTPVMTNPSIPVMTSIPADDINLNTLPASNIPEQLL